MLGERVIGAARARPLGMKVASTTTLGLLLALGACGESNQPYYPPQETAAVATSNMPAPAAAPAPEEVPTCEKLPASGTLLAGKKRPADEGHTVSIDNGGERDAVIKVRNAKSDKVVASMFVQKGSEASLEGLPDGDYRIQYAFGALDERCRKLARIDSAGAFPGIETFETEERDGKLFGSRVTLTLHSVPGGTVKPQVLDPAAFDTE